MTERDLDKDLSSLKERIKELVGEERIKKINKILEISYKYDKNPEFSIEYRTKE